MRLNTGGNSMSDWSSNAAKRFINIRETKQAKEETVAHEQKMVELKAPEIWEELYKAFDRKCTEFNSEPGVGNILSLERTGLDEFRITRSDTHATMTVTFLRPFYSIGWDILKEPGSFKFDVIDGTTDVGLFYRKGDTNITTYSTNEDIATMGLDVFLAN
jgi:hypothetical protein